MVSRVQHAVPTWSDSVILRVALESQGYVGFIEVDSSSTLQDARKLIEEDLEDVIVPGSTAETRSLATVAYRFLLPDGVPIASKQETRRLAMDFLPCLFIRVVEPPSDDFSRVPETTAVSSSNSYPAKEGWSHSRTESNKITVSYGNDNFSAWVTPSYTFGQLRKDAAQFWNVKHTSIVLLDQDMCAWPEEAFVNFALHKGLVHKHKVYMHMKRDAPGAPQNLNSSDNKKLASPSAGTARPRTFALFRSDTSGTYDPLASPSNPDKRAAREVTKMENNENCVSKYAMGYCEGSAHNTLVLNRYSQLWRCFTYYCIQGNALTPDKLDSRRLLLMMRDCRVLGAQVSPTVVSLIYTSCTCAGSIKNQRNSSMNFDQFLDALVMVAKKLFPRKVADAEGVSQALALLLTQHILPFASSWSSLAWERMAQVVYSAGMLSTLEPFISGFYDIFQFYAPQVSSNQVDMESELSLPFPMFHLFGLDFSLNTVGLTMSNMAEVFLASVECKGIGVQMAGENGDFSFGIDPDDTPESGSVACLQQSGSAAWDNTVMYFPQFLDAVVRLALFAFGSFRKSQRNSLDSEGPSGSDMVLALLQHMTKELRRYNLIHLVEKRHNLSTYPTGFVKGATKLLKTFTSLWTSQGQPDFLSRNTLDLHARQPKSDSDDVVFVTDHRSEFSLSATRGREVLSHIVHQERLGQLALHPSAPLSPSSPHRNRINWYPQSQQPSRFRAPGGTASDPEFLDQWATLQGNQQGVQQPASIQVTRTSDPMYGGERAVEEKSTATGGAKGKVHSEPSSAKSQSQGRRNKRSNKAATQKTTKNQGTENVYPPSRSPNKNCLADEPRQLHDPRGKSLAAKAKQGTTTADPRTRRVGQTHPKKTPTASVPTREKTTDELEISINDHQTQGNKKIVDLEDEDVYEAQDDEEEESKHDNEKQFDSLMRVLTRGEVFLKHGRRGTPHRRFVWYDPTNMRMCWCPANKRDNHGALKGRYIDMRSVRSVASGRVTDVFKHSGSSVFSKSTTDHANPDDARCFSLVATERTLDLEADTPGIRDHWIEALQHLKL